LISEETSKLKGKSPFRAFTYIPGLAKRMGSTQKMTLSFRFKTEGIANLFSFVKILFWTDGHNILGLLPKGTPSAKQKSHSDMKMLIQPQDDYPNKWKTMVSVSDDVWYHIEVLFDNTAAAITIKLDGTAIVVDSPYGLSWPGNGNGPQMGLYSFDYGGSGSSTLVKIWFKDVVAGCP